MTILLVDDDVIKIDKIKRVIVESLHLFNHNLIVKGNVADAMEILLLNRPVDLLILDMNLPVRRDSAIKRLAGLNLLKEINRRSNISKPESIVGLTSYKNEEIASKADFEKEGWAIVHCDLKLSEWENTIANKLIYLMERKKSKEISDNGKEKILFIAASPTDQQPLNAGIEQRKIDEILNSSTFRDRFQLISKPGAKIEIFSRELMQHNPSFVHFSGHGDVDGLAMEDDNGVTIMFPDLAVCQLFSLFKDTIKCVVLSACYSSSQAKAISKNNIYVVGMNNSVGVDAATEFAKGFYQAIGEGKDIPEAFRFGLVHLIASDPRQIAIPELWQNGKKI